MSNSSGYAGGVKMNQSLPVAGAGRFRRGDGSSPHHRLGRPARVVVRDVAGFGTRNFLLGPAFAGFGGVLQILPVNPAKTIKHTKTQKNTGKFSPHEATAFGSNANAIRKSALAPLAPLALRPIRPNRTGILAESFPPLGAMQKRNNFCFSNFSFSQNSSCLPHRFGNYSRRD
jgi:hypothetical protein